jgi:hypothetical protein
VTEQSRGTAEQPEQGRTGNDLAGLTDRQMAEIVELVVARCLEDMIQAMPAEVVSRYGVRLGTFGPAVAMAMREVDVPMLNRIVGLASV